MDSKCKDEVKLCLVIFVILVFVGVFVISVVVLFVVEVCGMNWCFFIFENMLEDLKWSIID